MCPALAEAEEVQGAAQSAAGEARADPGQTELEV